MKKFAFHSPSSLAEVWDLLEHYGDRAKLIAGGTDLVVQMKRKIICPEAIINLLPLADLKGIERKNDHLRLGALVTHAALASSILLKENWLLLAEAVQKVGSPQIRNIGTIGGNLANASPAADTAPPLLVLEGKVILASRKGERQIPLSSFFLGPGLTILKKDELLKEILIPIPPAGARGSFLKLGRRKSLDLAVVSVATLILFDSHTSYCHWARIALGAVAPRPIRAQETEKFLCGKILNDAVIKEASRQAQEECQPISDVRASADYRREMVKVMVERALKKSMGLHVPPTGI